MVGSTAAELQEGSRGPRQVVGRGGAEELVELSAISSRPSGCHVRLHLLRGRAQRLILHRLTGTEVVHF